MERVYFKPYPKQNEFLEAVFSPRYKLLGFGGSMGGGKTFVCCAALLLLHRLYPGARSAVIRDNLQRLKSTTIPSFKKVCDPKFIESWNQQTQVVTFKNGGELMFIGEDYDHDKDLDKFKGLELNWAFLEQMEELRKETLDMMFMRCGRHIIPNMPQVKILYSINPSPTWVRQYCYDHYIKGTLPENHFYLPSNIEDNPAVAENEDYMAGLQNMDSIARQRYIEGDWDAFKGKNPFAYAFNESKHVANLEMEITEPLFISFDFNWQPMTCTIWQHYDNKIRCLYEFETNDGLVALCNILKEFIGWEGNELQRAVFITGDRSGWSKSPLVEGSRTAYDIIQKELNLTPYQIKAPASNPSHLKARLLCNSLLEKHPDFLIDARCNNFIFDCRFVECDEEHEIVKDRNKQEGKADYLDTFKYYCATFHGDFVRL